MKLLKIQVQGVPLFKNDMFELDLYAKDRVPLPEDETLAPNDVFRLAKNGAIYSQNIIGLAGVNATGKTTALNLIYLVLNILTQPTIVRGFANSTASRIGKINKKVTIRAIFWQDGHYYLLESKLEHALGPNKENDTLFVDTFSFIDETLWQFRGSRISRSDFASFENFKKKSQIITRRNGPEDDETVLPKNVRAFLNDGLSIVFPLIRKEDVYIEGRNKKLPERTLSTPIVQAFDNSVEYLEWNAESSVYKLKFFNEPEQIVSADVANTILSRGTVEGSELVTRAVDVLKRGGCLVIDEIEEALNRSLVSTVIDLFASPITNPHGAQLFFSTHFPQLLDSVHRKDNIYVLVRNENYKTEAIKFSDKVKRIENKKSEVIMANLIKGSTPRYPDVQAMRDYVRNYVSE